MRNRWFYFVFGALGGLLLLFVILPLVNLYAGNSWGEMKEAAVDGPVLAAFANSFILAAVTAVLAVVFGTPLAYLLARKKIPATEVWQGITDLPLAVPHSIAGIALLMFLGRKTVAGALFGSVMGFNFTGTRVAIVAAMLFVSLPYAVSAARESFESINVRIEHVAASLGAPPSSVFFRVSLPLARGGIFSGAILTWARSISEFGAVVVLAYHPMTAPVKIWDEFTVGTLESSGAIAALFLIVCLGAFVVMRFLSRKRRKNA